MIIIHVFFFIYTLLMYTESNTQKKGLITLVNKGRSRSKNDKKNANYNQGIENVNLSDACTEYMEIFGANNNLMRHIPGIYDGLLK